jgi:hypothetical protein
MKESHHSGEKDRKNITFTGKKILSKSKMNEKPKMRVQRTNPHLKTPKEANKIEQNKVKFKSSL